MGAYTNGIAWGAISGANEACTRGTFAVCEGLATETVAGSDGGNEFLAVGILVAAVG